MQLYMPTLPMNLPNPGLPPLGFPAKKEEFRNYLPGYKGPVISDAVYKLPGINKGRIILPGNINKKIEDYKPITLEKILFN